MTTIRALHDTEHPFVMVARGVAQDASLSYEALGLLTYLLSKPDTWKIVPENLSREACGKNRAYKLLNELKEAGYITQERSEAAHDKPPVWGDRVLCEQPVTSLSDTARIPSSRDTVSPDMANAASGEKSLTNTELKDKKQRQEQNTLPRTPIRKDFDDVPKQDRLEIIKAWSDNLPIPPVSVYTRDAYHRAAAEIFRDGYRGHQVALFVKAKMADPYWLGKTLTLVKVGELMPAFLLDYGTSGGESSASRPATVKGQFAPRGSPPANGNGKHAVSSGNDGILGLMQAAKGAK